MILADLICDGIVPAGGALDIPVSGITADSRQVAPGMLFAAIPGTKVHGMSFIHAALGKGASALLVPHRIDGPRPEGVTVLVAKEPRRALALMAARFYPRQPRTVVAVTGTSGKTSVASFARQIFAFDGLAAASLGTLGLVTPAGEIYGSLTTPDPIDLARTLDQLAGEGMSHLAIEASSHGLDQFRLDGVRLSAAAFTNLSRDHLDYHPSVEAYLAAKLRLVRELLPDGRTMVVNADGAAAEAFIEAARARNLPVLTVGENGGDLRLTARERHPGGQRLSLSGPFGRAEIDLPLAGDFQAANALVAAGLAIAVGRPPAKVFAALEALQGVKGRLDKVGEVAGASIYVDYAHKPDALENVLQALRPYTRGRLIVVFGCGGDRDAGKRPIMGEIAVRRADVTIVTDDNPRGEDAASIRAAILVAAPGAREIGDRGAAIVAAVDMLLPGDVLVIAGKGHEIGQIIGNTVLPFSDHEAARAAMTAREARA